MGKDNEMAEERGILQVSFFVFGIGGLCAWNSILSTLDFFIKFQGEYDPSFTYPMANFILNVVFQFLLVFFGNKFSYRVQITVSLLISSLALVLLPIVVRGIENKFVGFILSMVIIVFQGLANSILLSGFYGISSFLPFKYIIAFSTGQGLSGIIMNIIRYVILLSFGETDDEYNITIGAIIFYGIAALLVLSNLIFLHITYNDKFFLDKIQAGENNVPDEEATVELKTSKKNKTDFYNILASVSDLCVLIIVNYLVTFICFPGLTLKGQIFDLNASYNVNTLFTIFNVFDTIGRYLAGCLQINRDKSFYLIFARFFFCFSFPALAYSTKNLRNDNPTLNSILVIINLILFAISNGLLTSVIFSIAPGLVASDELKGKVGSTISLCLIIGIFSGTLYALLIVSPLI